MVEYPSDRYSDISDLSGLMIDTGTGGQVALTDIAEVVYESSPTSISREMLVGEDSYTTSAISVRATCPPVPVSIIRPERSLMSE